MTPAEHAKAIEDAAIVFKTLSNIFEQRPNTIGQVPGALRAMERIQAALRVGVESQEVPQGWREIETAPKDGSAILAFYSLAQGKVHAGCYTTAIYEDGHWCNPEDTDEWYADPTHWMALPPAPKP